MHRVTIQDDFGNVVLVEDVDITLAGSNAEERQAKYGQIEWEARLAAYLVAPEICPFDCDHCRQ